MAKLCLFVAVALLSFNPLKTMPILFHVNWMKHFDSHQTGGQDSKSW